MKPWLAIISVMAIPLRAWSEPEPKPVWKFRVEVQMVALPMAEGLKLVPQLRGAATFAAAHARLQILLGTGKAELLAWPVVQGVSDLSGSTQSSKEIPYEDWEPPAPNPPQTIPYSLYIPEFSLRDVLPTERRFPLGIERRSFGAGLSVESEPAPETGGLRLEIKPSYDRFLGMSPMFGAGPTAPDGHQFMDPKGEELATSCTLIVRKEERRLLNTFVRKVRGREVVVFLLHAVVQPPPKLE